MLARLGRVLLILAVLLAQQTALAHEYWHAFASQNAEQPKSPVPKGSKLCDLHDLLGTVLGVVSGTSLGQNLLSPAEGGFIPVRAPHARSGLLSPQSRGPPLIS